MLFIATEVATFRLGCALLPLGQQLPSAQAQGQIDTVGARFLVSAARTLDCVPADARRIALPGFPGAFLLASGASAPMGDASGASAPMGDASGDPAPTGDAERRFGAGGGCQWRFGAWGYGGTAILLTSSGTTGVPKTIRPQPTHADGYPASHHSDRPGTPVALPAGTEHRLRRNHHRHLAAVAGRPPHRGHLDRTPLPRRAGRGAVARCENDDIITDRRHRRAERCRGLPGGPGNADPDR